VPLLAAGKELGVEAKVARRLESRLEAAEEAAAAHPLAAVADLGARLALLQRRQALDQVGGAGRLAGWLLAGQMSLDLTNTSGRQLPPEYHSSAMVQPRRPHLAAGSQAGQEGGQGGAGAAAGRRAALPAARAAAPGPHRRRGGGRQ
jgi:hypothetical protein